MTKWKPAAKSATAPVVSGKSLIDQDLHAYQFLQRLVDSLVKVPGSERALELANKFAQEPSKYKADFLAEVEAVLTEPSMRGKALRAAAMEVFADMRQRSAIESAFEDE